MHTSRFALAVALVGSSFISTQSWAQSPSEIKPGLKEDCSNPVIDPGKTFIQNFLNSCYVTKPAISGGVNGLGGDKNALYDLVFYQNNPNYEVLLVGNYPDTRYFSLTGYDGHAAINGTILDQNVQPLTGQYQNPYQVGETFESDQWYGARFSFGGVQPPEGQITPGCDLSGYNFQGNYFDLTQRHSDVPPLPEPLYALGVNASLNWNYDAEYGVVTEQQLKGFPFHQAGPNAAGSIMLRRYIDADPSQHYAGFIVRELTHGCAVPLSVVQSQLQVLTADRSVSDTWPPAKEDETQVNYHDTYDNQVLPPLCYEDNQSKAGKQAGSGFMWFRSGEYIPGPNPDAGYLGVAIPSNVVQQLSSKSSDLFLRFRFRLPTVPNTPCAPGAGCSLTGLEQLRYWSMSFQRGGTTLASLSDQDLSLDANGYATLIVGLGATPPAWVTAANHYTYFDLSQVENFRTLNTLAVRNMVTNPSFQCSVDAVPFRTTEYNPYGGYMGEYVPLIDVIDSADIPMEPIDVTGPNSCGMIPDTPPQPCTDGARPAFAD